MTAVKTQLSTQLDAPVLSGTAGALRNILKTCLVDGRGAAAISALTAASGVATATFAAAHPYIVGSVVAVTGAVPSAFNGEARVLSVPTSTSITFATAAPDGAATTPGAAKLAPAGWGEQYNGTNISVFRPGALDASGSVLRIADTSTAAARVISYESMSDANTGLGPSPTNTQISDGGYWPKSNASDATARSWFVVADPRGVLVGVACAPADRYSVRWWGDIASLRSGDAWSALLTCDNGDRGAAVSPPEGCVGTSDRAVARVGAYMQRSYTGLGGAVQALRVGSHHNGLTVSLYAGQSGYSFGAHPNQPNFGLMLCPLEVWEGNAQRGTVPGLWHAYMDCGNAFATGDIVLGTDDLAGRRLMAVRVQAPSQGATAGTIFIDLTGPWAR